MSTCTHANANNAQKEVTWKRTHQVPKASIVKFTCSFFMVGSCRRTSRTPCTRALGCCGLPFPAPTTPSPHRPNSGRGCQNTLLQALQDSISKFVAASAPACVSRESEMAKVEGAEVEGKNEWPFVAVARQTRRCWARRNTACQFPNLHYHANTTHRFRDLPPHHRRILERLKGDCAASGESETNQLCPLAVLKL